MLILEISEWIISLLIIATSTLMIGIGLFLFSLFVFAIKDWYHGKK